jgi:hypothetical protein
MADLSDRETFEHWLAGIEPAERRREIKHALAARSTLRVVPLLGRMKGDAVTEALVLPTLRVAALAWVAGKYSAHEDALRSAPEAAAALSDALRVFGAGQVLTSVSLVVDGTAVYDSNTAANALDATLFPCGLCSLHVLPRCQHRCRTRLSSHHIFVSRRRRRRTF